MPRQRKGQLILKAKGYYGKYWKMVNGVEKRVTEFLHTKNRLLAESRLAALIDAEANGRAATVIETVRAATVRIQGERAKTREAGETEQGYMRKWVLPAVGTMLVTEVTEPDIAAVLEKARDSGLAQETILKIRNAAHHVFAKLVKEKKRKDNPVPAAAEIPEALPETFDDRPKAVLTDDELLHYLAYTDPRESEAYLGALRERQLMALLSRCAGGMRSKEVQGITWARARAPETFEALEVIRYKTRRKAGQQGSRAVGRQLYPLGDTVLPFFLRYWYVRTTQLAGGQAPSLDRVMFPVRAGAKRLGEKRQESYFAKALRRDIKRAFGVEVWRAGDSALPPTEGARQVLRLRNAGLLQKDIAAELKMNIHTVRRVLWQNKHLVVALDARARVLGALADQHPAALTRQRAADQVGMVHDGGQFEKLWVDLLRGGLVENTQGGQYRIGDDGWREGGLYRITETGRREVAAVREAAAKVAEQIERDDFVPRGGAVGGKWTAEPSAWTRRLRELLEGTDDRKHLIFHNSRNAAAVAAERFERLKAASKFTAHASASMLQLYRERAGEVDVVPVAPELIPDGERLCAILRGWCVADGIDPVVVFGTGAATEPPAPPSGSPNPGEGKRPSEKAQPPTTVEIGASVTVLNMENRRGSRETEVGPWPSKSTAGCSNRPGGANDSDDFRAGATPEESDKGPAKRPGASITAENGVDDSALVAVLPPGPLTPADVRKALDAALVAGDIHLARRLNQLAGELEADRSSEPKGGRRVDR